MWTRNINNELVNLATVEKIFIQTRGTTQTPLFLINARMMSGSIETLAEYRTKKKADEKLREISKQLEG